MSRTAISYILYSQVVFFISFVVCFLIRPHILFSDDPLSLYGNLRVTILPYALGLLVPACLILKAAVKLPKQPAFNQILSRIMIILAITLMGVLITPYTVNTFFYVAHGVFSFGLFVIELLAALWLLRRDNDLYTWLLVPWQLFGVILAFLSLKEVHVLRILALGQLIAVSSFGVLMARSIAHVEKVNLREITKASK